MKISLYTVLVAKLLSVYPAENHKTMQVTHFARNSTPLGPAQRVTVIHRGDLVYFVCIYNMYSTCRSCRAAAYLCGKESEIGLRESTTV